MGLLDAGFSGVALVRDGRWTAFGWFSRPGARAPRHLPRWVQGCDSYWIFHGHTASDMRRQGCFMRVLGHIIQIARRQHPEKLVYVDVDLDNTISRRALLLAGFQTRRRGAMRTYYFWLPRLVNVAVKGSWRRTETHPRLAAGKDRLGRCEQAVADHVRLTV